MSILTRIKKFIDGYKTYATAIAAVVIAVAAWAGGELTNVQFGASLFAAAQTLWIRAAIAKAADQASTAAYNGAVMSDNIDATFTKR